MSEHLGPLRRGSYWVALFGFLAFAVLGSVGQTVAARGNLAMGDALFRASFVVSTIGTLAFLTTLFLGIRLASRRAHRD
jgi:uncharacterized membrane protein YhaH (DUF805 family)